MKGNVFLYICPAVWLIFPCAVFLLLAGTDNMILIGTHGTVFLIQIILNWTAALSGIALALLRYRGTSRSAVDKVILSLCAAGIAALLLGGNFLCRLADNCEEYHSFLSPDGVHTVVIMEKVDPVSGQATLYERVNPVFIVRKGAVITNNGYRPVCAGAYTLEWEEDTVTLTVSDGMGGQERITAALHRR